MKRSGRRNPPRYHAEIGTIIVVGIGIASPLAHAHRDAEAQGTALAIKKTELQAARVNLATKVVLLLIAVVGLAALLVRSQVLNHPSRDIRAEPAAKKMLAFDLLCRPSVETRCKT